MALIRAVLGFSYAGGKMVPGLAETLDRSGYQGGRDLEDGDIVVQFEAYLADVEHALDDGTALLYVLLRQNLLCHPQRHLLGW